MPQPNNSAQFGDQDDENDQVRFVDDISDYNSDEYSSMAVDDEEEDDDDGIILEENEEEEEEEEEEVEEEEEEESSSDNDLGHSRIFNDSMLDGSDNEEDFESENEESLNHSHNSLSHNVEPEGLSHSSRRRRSSANPGGNPMLSFLPPSSGRSPVFLGPGGEINIGALLSEAMAGSLEGSGYDNILRSLRSSDEDEIMTGLSELSEMFLMPHQQFGLPMMPVVAISKALVNVLQQTSSIEVQVMAARAIAQFLDAGMGSNTARALVSAGLVPIIKQLFENVFYIDLIEQLIHVVKPIAAVEPQLMLTSGCLSPCVATLDFFNEHIQRQAMVAIESCTKAINAETFESARDLLAIFPEHPNPFVLATYSALLISLARYSNVKDFVTEHMWEVLVGAIQSGTPHVARIMRATAHVAAQCPEYIADAVALASTVVSLLVPIHESSNDYFNRLISVSKDDLFGGLKLLQALLSIPPAIGSFSGPYRRNQSEKQVKIDNIAEFSRIVMPLLTAAYSATASSQVRQLTILVVLQITSALKKLGTDAFKSLTQELNVLNFASQIIAESSESLILVVGGLDLVWEFLEPDTLVNIRDSSVCSDLEQYIPEKESGELTPKEPKGHFGPQSDLLPLSEYMASVIVSKVNQVAGDCRDRAVEVVDAIKRGNSDLAQLQSVPIASLIKAGMLDVLSEKRVEHYLSEELVCILQAAVSRLEKFPLELTGSRASSLEELLNRAVYVRIAERNVEGDPRAWSATVPILATLESIEDFVRARIFASSLRDSNQTSASAFTRHIKFYAGDTRLPRDISVMKAIAGQTGMPVIFFDVVSDDEEEEDENEPNTDHAPETVPPQLLSVLEMLKALVAENERLGEPVPWSAFRSSKLAAKLSRQVSDILAVSTSMLPQWTFDTVRQYPFLYPLEVRLHFVQLTSFGMGRNLRLLRRMQQESEDADDGLLPEVDESSRILGRNKRQKFRLARDNILEGSLKILEHSSKSPAIIEVMFNNEEGTGRGPTQEFFALSSRALSNPQLDMWSFTKEGLFPKANLSPSHTVLRYFKGMGVLVARALVDKRILDFQLNPAFFDAVISNDSASVSRVKRVDPEMAKSLDILLDTEAKDLDKLGLDFTVPGTDKELLPGGTDIEVNAENISDYVNLVCDYIVGSGIEQQISAFISGFSSTLPITALSSFMLHELATLCGADRPEDWSIPTLRDALRFQHGYTVESDAVKFLMNVLSQFTTLERRKFLVFITGSPHLPVGGFKALQPPLTVVVKPPDNEDLEPDQYLPSVMTCVNYFKLPDYSDEQTLSRQLKVAMSEGSGSFPLS